jgi:hypothetical protein
MRARHPNRWPPVKGRPLANGRLLPRRRLLLPPRQFASSAAEKAALRLLRSTPELSERGQRQ